MWTTIRSDRHRASAAILVALSVAFTAHPSRADEPAPAAPTAAPTPNPLDSLRERFRAGMDKYKAGAFADAVVIWEAIYRELGTDKGYRLAFDLARAYDELGDLIKAADHYESYLEQVAQRRAIGETLEANVERQEEVARERLEKIAALKARIRVKAGPKPTIVQVDNAPARVAGFTVYVEPGAHVVTFGSGKDADVRRVAVALGAIVDVEPKGEAQLPPPPETRFETRVEHPFSPAVLWIGGALAHPPRDHLRERALDQERLRRPDDRARGQASPRLRLRLCAHERLCVGRGSGRAHRGGRRPRPLVRPRHEGNAHPDHAVRQRRPDRHVARRVHTLLAPYFFFSS